MSMSRAYRASRRSRRAEETRDRIVAAVRQLLEEGAFHDSTVDEVAERAGIARATLYQHFRSRLDLVDAICDTFDANPALLRVREVVGLADAATALAETIANCVQFWASEDAVLHGLYGVVAVDPAARALVGRQRVDRRAEMRRLARRLRAAGRLREGVSERGAVATLMVLTSYETFRELREAALPQAELIRTLQESARTLLVG
jgi:AcrR family transcriptional regulator